MKTLAFILMTLLLVSCGTPKTVIDSKRVIKGDWVLNTITYNQTGTFNVKLLGDASKGCFEGSYWQFIPNNNTGTYEISNTSCPSGKRYFIFAIQQIDQATGLYDFLIKPTNEKKKSETNSGYRFRLSQLSDTNMQWQQTVYLDGKPFTASMNFSKK